VTAPTLLSRGFTGHEHLDDFNLINMNGRVYDPYLGLFVSPDNNIQSPTNVQNYNRYSYCLGNPLMYVDPSGNTWFTTLGNDLGPNGRFFVEFGVAALVSIGAFYLGPEVGIAATDLLQTAMFSGMMGNIASSELKVAFAGGNGMAYFGAGVTGGVIGGAAGLATFYAEAGIGQIPWQRNSWLPDFSPSSNPLGNYTLGNALDNWLPNWLVDSRNFNVFNSAATTGLNVGGWMQAQGGGFFAQPGVQQQYYVSNSGQTIPAFRSGLMAQYNQTNWNNTFQHEFTNNTGSQMGATYYFGAPASNIQATITGLNINANTNLTMSVDNNAPYYNLSTPFTQPSIVPTGNSFTWSAQGNSGNQPASTFTLSLFK